MNSMTRLGIWVGFFLLGSLLTTSVQSQTLVGQANQDEISPRLLRKFKRDAARLALRLEAGREDLRYLNIYIPDKTAENILGVLTNIYKTDETAKSISNCNVHTFPDPSIDHFIVIFDREIEWASLLRQGITETLSEDFNSLLDDYDLIIEKHVQWNDTQDAITIRSTEPLNMAALANEFYNIDGIESIDFGLPKVQGNDIQLSRIKDGWEVEYILKFGSYISGEGKSHSWIYQALDNGKILFKEEKGEPVPSWMRCEVAEGLKSL